tara:strand:+ start:2249 stop:2641 length:393 start_codon:yes stop_codon:yes gene_type:complete
LRKENNNKRAHSHGSRGRSKPRHQDAGKVYHVLLTGDESMQNTLGVFLADFGYPVEPLSDRPGSEKAILSGALEGAEGYLFPNDLVDFDLLSSEWNSFSTSKGLTDTPLLAKIKVVRGKSSVSRRTVGRT